MYVKFSRETDRANACLPRDGRGTTERVNRVHLHCVRCPLMSDKDRHLRTKVSMKETDDDTRAHTHLEGKAAFRKGARYYKAENE